MYPPKAEQEVPVSKTSLYPAPEFEPPQQIATGYPSTFQNVSAPPQYVQPPHSYPQQGGPVRPTQWSSGLCACRQDPSNCCLTCFCPCITFGQIAEIVDEGSTQCALSGGIYAALCYFTGCACIYSCLYRNKMRTKHNLVESPCADCLVHCFCDACALCQNIENSNTEDLILLSVGKVKSTGWVPPWQLQGMQLCKNDPPAHAISDYSSGDLGNFNAVSDSSGDLGISMALFNKYLRFAF